jgi:hypothetical protein
MAVKVKMNSKGSRELLKSPEVQAELKRRADAIAQRAGAGFVAKVKVGKTRALASVSADTADAMRAEATDRVLLKALDAAR